MFDGRHQVFQFGRFEQMAIESGALCLFAYGCVAQRAEGHDMEGLWAPGAQQWSRGEARHVRHREVEKDHVGREAVRTIERLGGAEGSARAVAEHVQEVTGHRCCIFVVVDNQDAGGRMGHGADQGRRQGQGRLIQARGQGVATLCGAIRGEAIEFALG